ncbi:hypothetical protein QTP88_000005 [Uroleucon formosanum]
MDLVDVSPSKKNPRGKFVGTDQKQIIINMYKDKIKQQLENPDSPKLTYRQMLLEISKSSGIGQRTVQTTLAEYKTKGTVSSPNKKKIRPTILEKVDSFDKDAIRRKIHGFWLNREVPTLPKMLVAINEDDTLPNFKPSSFRKILKDLQFVYAKKSGNSALIEREDIIIWRGRYLDQIRKYREQNRPIYYLDETWVNAGETHSRTWRDSTVNSLRDAFLTGLTMGQKEPSGKGKRLIVLHIGSTDGFLPGGLLCFESKTQSTDYHDEMNGSTFLNVMSWKKQDIINWLESKGENISYPTTKGALLSQVQTIHTEHDKYVIDEYAKDNNKTVLRLPPYHCELNPIELAWSSVKSYVRTHNSTFKLKDVKELLERGVEHVTPEMWTNFVGHVVKEEEKFWTIDSITDDYMDEEPGRHILTIGDTSSDSDSD